MKELIEELRREAEYVAQPDIDGYSQEGLACRLIAAADTIERLELESTAWQVTVENLQAEIEGWKADQKENLKNQCDLVSERDVLETHNVMLRAVVRGIIKAADRKTDEFDDAKDALKQEHITDGISCWCCPDVDYTDPDTGASVIVHKEPQ